MTSNKNPGVSQEPPGFCHIVAKVVRPWIVAAPQFIQDVTTLATFLPPSLTLRTYKNARLSAHESFRDFPKKGFDFVPTAKIVYLCSFIAGIVGPAVPGRGKILQPFANLMGSKRCRSDARLPAFHSE